MINEATLRHASMPPELLPDSQFNDITANQEVSPPILDLRRFPGKLLRLSEVAVTRDSEVSLRIKADGEDLREPYNNAGGLFDLLPNNFQTLAKDRLYYNLFSTAGKTSFRTSFGVWVENLTVASKLKLGISLSGEEQAINKEFNIQNSVEKGILPLPLEEQVEREYRSQLISEETHSRTLSVDNTRTIVENVYPNKGECLVLTNLAATAGTAGNNIRLYISRDDDSDYVSDLKTYSVGLDRELSAFIPALSEVRVEVISGVAAGVTTSIRFTIWRCRLSNALKCRWGILSKEEAPGDVWEKVRAGLL